MKICESVLHGKPYVGKPHVRLDEGEAASGTPMRGSLLCTTATLARVILMGAFSLGAVAMEAFGDEIAWPSDFWAKVTNRLEAVEANCSTGQGNTPDMLDGTLKTTAIGSWITDFGSWVFDLGISAERVVDCRPSGFFVIIR